MNFTMNSSSIMTVQGGRISTNVAMLPDALRNNRPTRSESVIAAEVIEQLHAEVIAARRAGFVMAHDASLESAEEVLRPVERLALAASVAQLEALKARSSAEPLTPSEGESIELVLHELKRLQVAMQERAAILTERAQGATAAGPDPAVVAQEDMETMLQVEEMVRSSGFEEKADRLMRLHGVLLHVSQGREASHFRDSYDRALQRLVQMRRLIPEETIRSFEVEWRKRKLDPLRVAASLNLPEALRGELRQMADHCGAVSYSPPPMRAVRGVSVTFDQLESFAVLVSGAVWPVPGAELR
jgi:hypothetical protein